MMFNLIREQALICGVVEKTDENKRTRGKSGSGSRGGPTQSTSSPQRQRNSKLTCWACGK